MTAIKLVDIVFEAEKRGYERAMEEILLGMKLMEESTVDLGECKDIEVVEGTVTYDGVQFGQSRVFRLGERVKATVSGKYHKLDEVHPNVEIVSNGILVGKQSKAFRFGDEVEVLLEAI